MDIRGVEIFSVGEWNGDEYKIQDLQDMVNAFNENSVGCRPYLKLGHDDSQELLQKDGYPAAGWVDQLYIRGEKLVADFSGIPEKIYKLIEKQAYRKVSSEIFFNIKIGDKIYKRMLAAVALLGADNPGVMNLNDIMGMYKKYEGKYDKKVCFIKEVEIIKVSAKKPNKGRAIMEKTEQEIKLEFSLQQKEDALTEATAKLEAIEKSKAEKDAELVELKEFKVQAEKEKQELIMKAEKARIDKFTTELVAEKLATPSMKPMIAELLGPDKKEYAIKLKDKETKYSKEELLKEALKLFKAASEVNFVESSTQGDEETRDKEAELQEAAQKYADEHKVSFGNALKSVLAAQKNK